MSSIGPSIAATAVAACVGLGCGRVAFQSTVDAAADGASDAATSPALVQGAGSAALNVPSVAATLDGVPAAGNMLVLVGGGHVGALLTPVGASASWTRAAISTMFPNIEIWFGVADGSSVTVTIQSTAPTGMSLWVGEWRGLSGTNVLDSGIATAGTASPASAGTIVLSGAPELVIFAVNSFFPNTYGVPTGGTWTELDTQLSGDSIQRVWFQIAMAPGTVAPTVDETRHQWDAAIAAFRVTP
jgi:hypothetical protein